MVINIFPEGYIRSSQLRCICTDDIYRYITISCVCLDISSRAVSPLLLVKKIQLFLFLLGRFTHPAPSVPFFPAQETTIEHMLAFERLSEHSDSWVKRNYPSLYHFNCRLTFMDSFTCLHNIIIISISISLSLYAHTSRCHANIHT